MGKDCAVAVSILLGRGVAVYELIVTVQAGFEGVLGCEKCALVELPAQMESPS